MSETTTEEAIQSASIIAHSNAEDVVFRQQFAKTIVEVTRATPRKSATVIVQNEDQKIVFSFREHERAAQMLASAFEVASFYNSHRGYAIGLQAVDDLNPFKS